MQGSINIRLILSDLLFFLSLGLSPVITDLSTFFDCEQCIHVQAHLWHTFLELEFLGLKAYSLVILKNIANTKLSPMTFLDQQNRKSYATLPIRILLPFLFNFDSLIGENCSFYCGFKFGFK